MLSRRLIVLAIALLLISISINARVISYAPYTDHAAWPAHQNRMNRFFALVEQTPPVLGAGSPSVTFGQLVLYDSAGVEEPRVVFPTDGSSAVFTMAVVQEAGGIPRM